MIHVALASIRRPLEKGRAKRRIDMRRRRMLSSSGITPNCTQTSACLGLLLIMHLRCISIRPYRATLLQGSTHVGQVQQIYANPQHKFLSLTALRRANDAIKLRISFQRLEAIFRSSPKHADVGMQSNAP